MSSSVAGNGGDDVVMIRMSVFARIWAPATLLAFSVIGTALQIIHGRLPWQAVLIVFAALAFWMGRKPIVVADATGIRFRRGGRVRWSEVAGVVPPPDNGWKHQTTDLMLHDGTRRPFALDTDPSALVRIEALLIASRPDGGAGSRHEAEPE